MSQEYKDYRVLSNYSDYSEFKEAVNKMLKLGFIPIGGVSVYNKNGSTTYYAQAVAKLKEQPCQENQLILS